MKVVEKEGKRENSKRRRGRDADGAVREREERSDKIGE